MGLSDPSSVYPTFTPDAVGDYVIQLIVTDAAGLSSAPATVTISTVHAPPVADAVFIINGSVVQFNGSQSYDPAGLPITYQWTILSKPVERHATLTGPTTATPSFTADILGDYSIQLVVTDSVGTASSPAMVNLSFKSFIDVAPVANAGPSRSAVVGQTVTLNGSGSTDSDGQPLTYKWSIVSAPSGSTAAILNPTAQIASFVPDLPGTFVVQLIVNDAFLNSLPATAQIQAISQQTQVTTNIHSLQQNVIANLAPSSFKNATMQKAILKRSTLNLLATSRLEPSTILL